MTASHGTSPIHTSLILPTRYQDSRKRPPFAAYDDFKDFRAPERPRNCRDRSDCHLIDGGVSAEGTAITEIKSEEFEGGEIVLGEIIAVPPPTQRLAAKRLKWLRLALPTRGRSRSNSVTPPPHGPEVVELATSLTLAPAQSVLTPTTSVAQAYYNRQSRALKLCNTCIDPATIVDQKLSIVLGTLNEIKSRPHCPICRLALHSLRNYKLEASNAGRSAVCVLAPAETQSRDHTMRSCLVVYYGPKYSPVEAGRIIVDDINEFYNQVDSDFTHTTIDIAAVRLLLKRCMDDHVNCNMPHHDQGHLASLFIDVEEWCLVEGVTADRYVALSYVLGSKHVQTTRKNVEKFKLPYAFLSMENLPQTYRDAIDFVANLGEKFLWIDQLCIVCP
jgi:hypothetical protein